MLGLPASASEGDWPAPPRGCAQIGFVLLILIGALTILGGAGYALLLLIWDGTIFEYAMTIAAIALGAAIVAHSVRVFNERRWRPFRLPPEWAWSSAMVLIWGLGIVLKQALPGQEHWVLPPVIVGGAWVTSQLFLSATLHGLLSPAGRKAMDGRLPPRHRVLLATSLSASLSATIAVFLESVAVIGLMTLMLTTTQLVGDRSTFELLTEAAQDPQTLERLEEMITHSPAALLGLGCILVFIAPGIEELVKAIPLFLLARQGAGLSERTAILLGVAGGVGFAFIENVGYLSGLADEWWLAFWFRAAAAMMHGAASGFVGRAWYRGLQKGRWDTMLLDLCTGWGIHALWNALALVVIWFAYRDVTEGVLFCIGVGLVPLAILFTVMARWGIWVSEK